MKKLISIILLMCMLFNIVASAIPVMDMAESAYENQINDSEAFLSDDSIKPGINILTGSLATKNFTKDDLSTIVTTTGTSEIWTNNSLRLYPATPGAYIYSSIKLPTKVERPALLMADLWLMSTQMLLNGKFYEGPWESDRTIKNIQIDYPDTSYGYGDKIDITILDMGGTNVNIISNVVVIPYYKITYKTIFPDSTTGEDVYMYYLGTDEEKKSIKNNSSGIVGVPTSFVPSKTLSHEGAEFLGWSISEGAAIPESTISLDNEDVILYPVWSNAVVNDCIATIYLDEAKTAKRVVSAKEGETVKLPVYDDLSEYTPDGKMPEGFNINGKIYAPGTKYTFKASDRNIEITPVYKSLIDPEYGELIFLETFESVPETLLYDSDTNTNIRHRVSYINKAYSDIGDYFTIGKGDGGDDILITDDGKGNMAACVENDTGFRWPQFSIRKADGNFYNITDKGEYTLVADVMVPADSMDKITSVLATAYKNGDSDYISSYHVVEGSVANSYYPLKISIEINKQSYSSLNQNSFFANSSGEPGAKFYIDNIALYKQNAEYSITGLGIDGNTTISEIFVPGKTLKVPTQADVLQYAKPGYVVSGFTMGNKAYNLGDEIPTTENDRNIVLEAVYTKKNYKIYFSLGDDNGTLDEIKVVDGDRFKMPEISGVTAWKIPGTDITFAAGQTVGFDMSDVKIAGNLYSDTLFVEAVYQNAVEVNGFECKFKLEDDMFEGANSNERVFLKSAYGAGIIPATDEFDIYKIVTVGEVLEYAANLYNEYYGIEASYATIQETYEAMLAAGITGEISNLNADATVLDAVKMFANAVADNEFKILSAETHAIPEAQKLIRAGIISKDEDLDSDLSFGFVVDMIGKVVNTELRSASGVKVYIFGDSLCAGTGAPGYTGWIRKYANYWDNDISFVNYAVGGISSIHAFGQEGYRPAMDALKSGDYLFIALGTNDSTLWQDYQNVYNQPLTYDESLAAYIRMATEATAAGATPVFICPVGRNTVKNGVYYDGDPDIINCMKDAAAASGVDVTIINFKDITHERFGAMSESERAQIYHDSVHYTDYGANVVCGIFEELLLASDDYRLSVLKNTLLSEKSNEDFGNNETDEPDKPEEVYDVLTPGINAFTGSTAVKNFTAEDLSSIVTTEGSSDIWTDNSLRLYPPYASAQFYSSIKLPFTIDRPAIIITDLMLQSTQLMINSGWWGTGWEELKLLYNQKVDTGAEASYGKDTVGITILDIGGTNVNVLSNMAVVPYYQITYKNILPDRTAGEDIVKYYLGTDQEKANIINAATGLTGLPTKYTVDSTVVLTADNYIFRGWSLTENGRTVKNVSLRNEDIILYPVWEKTSVEPDEPDEPVVPDEPVELILTPGVNAFTGTTEAKNFTKEDLSSIVTTEGSAELWTNNSLRLYPPYAGAQFSSSIKLPFMVDRPAIIITDLMLQSTQLMINSGWWGTGWEELKLLDNQKVDTGSETSYGKDSIGITILDISGTNVNVLSNLAVIPYYQITYKNILPDGTTGEDVVKYYLGTEEEKATMVASSGAITGLPTRYTVENIALEAEGYVIAGWTTEVGGETVDTVALANEDVILYPVWKETNIDPDEPDEPVEPDEPIEFPIIPGVNAFTGTLATQNFETDQDMSLVSLNGATSEIWAKNRLRLYPVTEGTFFSANISLPGNINRPALSIANLHVMNTQIQIDGKLVVGGGDAYGSEKWINNLKIDTGEENSYGKDHVKIGILDLSTENVNIFYNLAVIPYYQITYRNILPDGTAGEDIVKYFLGSEREKSAITTSDIDVKGIPTSYPVDKSLKLSAEGYTFIGWASTENATDTINTINLANEDIILYPVWIEGIVDTPEDDEEYAVIPGMNAFTGTLATQNFKTEEELGLVKVYGGKLENWAGNRLRLYPNTAGSVFSAEITLPGKINRPALTITNLHVMSTQITLNDKVVVRSGDAYGFEKWVNNAIVDTGAEKDYGKEYVDIVIQDLSQENVNIFYNMAVIPYYQITYKNILPDGTQAKDVVKYYLGTEEEKAVIETSDTNLSGLPLSYPVDSSVRFMTDGYVVIGWSDTENSKEPIKNVALANKDIVLYPIWEKYVDFTMDISGDEQVYIGKTYKFMASFSEEIPVKDVVWSVNNEEIASIDENGVLTTKKAGIVTVTCTPLYNPDKAINMDIAVSYTDFEVEIVGLNSITKAYRSAEYTCKLISGELPINKFTWSIDNENLASINRETGKLTPYDNGVVTITATSVYNPEYSVSYAVTLTNQEGPKTLTYMPGTNDGSVSDLPEPTKGVGTIELSKNVPQREGYVFMGWSPEKGKINTVESVYLNNDKEVYAVWAEGIGIEFNGEMGKLKNVQGGTMQLTDEYLIVKSDASGDIRLHFNEFNIDPSEYRTIEFRMAVEKWDGIQVYYQGEIEVDGVTETYGYDIDNWKYAELYSVWGDHEAEGLDNWFIKKMDMFSAAPEAKASWFVGTADNIKNIWIDITSVPNSTVYIDYIRLISKEPQEETFVDGNGSASSNKVTSNPYPYDMEVENLTKPGELGGDDVSSEMSAKPLNFAGITDEIIVNFASKEDTALFGGMRKAEVIGFENSELTVNVFGTEESPVTFETYDINLDADSHRYVILKVKSIDFASKYLRMYFVPDVEHLTYSSERSAVTKIDDEYSMVIYDMSQFDKWTGTVSRLMFTLLGDTFGTIKLDWIMFTNEIPVDIDDIEGVDEVFPTVNKGAITFKDVSESDWFAADVSKAYNLGFVNGISDELFNPYGNITLAEAITIAVRINRIYNEEEAIVSDNEEQSWYAPYVADAIAKGIIKKVQYSNYDIPATRKEVAQIIYNALPSEWFNAINVFDELPDLEKKDKTFGAVKKLYEAGVLTGSDENYSFMPETNITRAELATILCRCAIPEMRKRIITEAERKKRKLEFYADDLKGALALSGFDWHDVKVNNGLAWAKTTFVDPIIHLNRLAPNLDGGFYNTIRIGMKWDTDKIDNPIIAGCQIFFQTAVSDWSALVPEWDGTTDESGVGEFVFNIRSNSKADAVFTSFRFDPFDVADVDLAIAYIIIE